MNFKYGYSFYPEHCADWNEIEKDIDIIVKSGANTVRMAEFSWDKLEPVDGIYNFKWLEDVINRLGKNGINTILCTPTAAPPIWLHENHKIQYIDNRDVEKPFGGRRHFCPNRKEYRFYSKRIVRNMAEYFGNNPYICGWQIDNELSGRCHCDECKKKFAAYLKNKFDNDINALNRAYGTYFWAQTYKNFEQIPMPSMTIEPCGENKFFGLHENPSLRLDYERFSSDSYIEFMNMQIDEIKKFSNKPITHNSTGFALNSIDYYKMYEKADVYGLDQYPPLLHGDLTNVAFNYSAGRGYKDEDFWVMEFAVAGGHSTGGGGRIQPFPGAIEQSVVHSYAHGAAAMIHFQYKTFRSGAEQLNYALIDADRVPRRRYFEFQNTAKKIREIENIIGSSKIKKREIAIVFDYSAYWAVCIKPLNRKLGYLDYIYKIFSILSSMGYNADIISYDKDIEQYKMVITPMPVLMPEKFKSKIKKYVSDGGCYISSFATAIKDYNNLGEDRTLPAGLTDLFGATVKETEPIEKNINECLLNIKSYSGEGLYWLDTLDLTEANPIGIIKEKDNSEYILYKNGECAVSENKYGKGKAIYLGVLPDDDLIKNFLGSLLEEMKAHKLPIQIQNGIDAASRVNKAGKEFIFIFNHNRRKSTVLLDGTYKNIIDNTICSGNVVIEPKGYVCLYKD